MKKITKEKENCPGVKPQLDSTVLFPESQHSMVINKQVINKHVRTPEEAE